MPRNPPNLQLKHWLRGAGVYLAAAATMFVSHWAGYTGLVGEQQTSTIWFPTGVVLAWLLLSPRRRWAGLLAIAFACDMAYSRYLAPTGGSFIGRLPLGLLNVVGALGSAALVERFQPQVRAFAGVRDVIVLTLAPGFVLAGGAAVASAWNVGLADGYIWFFEAQRWWSSDLLGVLIVVPLALSTCGPGRWESIIHDPRQLAEAGALLASLAVLQFAVYQLSGGGGDTHIVHKPHVIFPLLIWAALRMGSWMVSVTLLLIAVLQVQDLVRGTGPYFMDLDGDSARLGPLYLQFSLGVLSLTMLLLAKSVAERRRAMTALRQNQAWFNAMAGTLPSALWLMHLPEEAVAYISPGFERIAGRPVSEVLGRPGAWTAMVHPDDRPELGASLERLKQRGHDEITYRIVRPDGKVRWVRAMSAGVFDDQQAMVQLVGSVEDITHKHEAAHLQERMHAELAETYERHQRFMRLSSECIYRVELGQPIPVTVSFEEFLESTARHGRIAECNDAFARTYGFDCAHEPVGRLIEGIFLLNDAQNIEYLRRFHASGCTGSIGETHCRNADGSDRWFLTTFAGDVSRGLLRGIWGTHTNITEMRRLNDQLRESQKMQAVGELAGGVAHDFNNLLTVISAHADLLEQHADGDERITGSLRIVREAVAHAAEVSRSLLAFGRRLPTQRTPVDVTEVVLQTQRMLSRTLPSTVTLEVELPPDPVPRVLGDAVQLQQVLLNLAINARDALPQATGSIRVVVESDQTQAGRVFEPRVRLSVIDDGAGMEPGVVERVFDPFFTTKPPGKGTGLGLSVARGIVEDHGGSIVVSSHRGRGTTITLELPFASQPQPAGTPPGGGPTDGHDALPPLDSDRVGPVLLAEDDPQIRAVIAGALVSRGFRVVQARDGLDMQATYQQQAAAGVRFAAIVADVDMPGRSGLDVLRELRLGGCDVPAIIMTGSVDLSLDPATEGDTVLLTKPFGISQLCAVLQSRIGEAARASRQPLGGETA